MFAKIAAAAALVASVSASSSFATDPNQYNGNSSCDASLTTTVKVVNRCPYDVYLWSVLKGQGCPSSDAVVLGSGDFYHENYRPAYEGSGVSLKVSKDSSCGSSSLLQLEYFIDSSDAYAANYWDVSYVNCQSKDCPTADYGYYAISGNQGSYASIAGADTQTTGAICPTLSCSSYEDCGACSYINPDDTQTKSCNKEAPLSFYLCGSEAPGDESTIPASSAAASSSKGQSSAPAAYSSSSKASSSAAAAEANVQKAAITAAPAAASKAAPNVKTEVVYVTEIAYVNAKRHAHSHAHAARHQHFRA